MAHKSFRYFSRLSMPSVLSTPPGMLRVREAKTCRGDVSKTFRCNAPRLESGSLVVTVNVEQESAYPIVFVVSD